MERGIYTKGRKVMNCRWEEVWPGGNDVKTEKDRKALGRIWNKTVVHIIKNRKCVNLIK